MVSKLRLPTAQFLPHQYHTLLLHHLQSIITISWSFVSCPPLPLAPNPTHRPSPTKSKEQSSVQHHQQHPQSDFFRPLWLIACASPWSMCTASAMPSTSCCWRSHYLFVTVVLPLPSPQDNVKKRLGGGVCSWVSQSREEKRRLSSLASGTYSAVA